MTFDPKEALALVERLDMFTPGPWVRDCWDILGKAPGTGVVAEICRPGELDSEFWKIGEPDNNASIIAAAPDLHAHLTAALDEIERLQEIERLVLAANTLREEYHALPNERLRPGSKESRKSRAKRLWLRAFDRAARKALKGADQ